MSNVVRSNGSMSKEEVKRSLISVDKKVADIISESLDLEDEARDIRAAIKRDEAKRMARLREITKLLKERRQQQSEAIGGRKVLLNLLKRLGLDQPDTKLTRLSERNEDVRALVESN